MLGPQRNIRLGRMKAFPIDSIGDNSEERVAQAMHGGKVILPNFVLRRVYRTTGEIMVFRLSNEESRRQVYCGVSTFRGEEPQVSVPLWVLKQLQIESGQSVVVELVTTSFPKGTFAKFEPMTRAFLQITDAKTVLEHCLRGYVCISIDDIISIQYNRNVYELRVTQTLPFETIIINECDLTVDFDEMQPTLEDIQLPAQCDLDTIRAGLTADQSNHFHAFSGVGRTACGVKVDADKQSASASGPPKSAAKGIPDFDYKVGSIFFKRHKKDLMPNEKSDSTKKELKRGFGPRKPITRSQTQPFRSQTEAQKQSSSGSQESKRRKTDRSSDSNGTD